MNNNMPSMMHGNAQYQSAVIHKNSVPMVEPGTSVMFPNKYIQNGNSQIHDREIGFPVCTMGPNQQGLMMHNPNGHIAQNRNMPMIQNSYGPMGPNPNMYIGQVPNGHMGPNPQALMVQNPHGPINPNIHCQISSNQHGIMSQVAPDMHYRARSNTQYPFTECRINEFNRRLQERTEACDNEWWDALITDFFEENAILNITFADDRPHKFCLCRAMIPRYFRSVFDSGCSEYFYFMRSARNYYSGSTIVTDSDSALMIMSFPKFGPPQSVTVEGRLVLVFNNNETMRIKSWTFDIRNNREYILKTITGPNDTNSNSTDHITYCGIPIYLLRFLQITKMMQESFRQKPKLIWQPMIAPIESSRRTYKRKKLKDASSNLAVKPKKSPNIFQMNTSQPSDVVVVGEPILMGDEYAGVDEHSITRLENIQFDGLVNDKMLNKSPNTRKINRPKLNKSGSVNSSSNSQHSITGIDQMPYFYSNTPDTKNSDLSPIYPPEN